MAWAYYNENDSFAADWLECLIWDGQIAGGDVDRRSIEDVTPNDLAGYTQHHFFAGIGGWSAALRLAGWPDDRPVWTGSCPCQPFSAAGHGAGFSDKRHLWPVWFRLIRECSPDIVLGEQVAAPAGLGWLDLVQADLESSDYACGAVDTCAASVGAPHIRQRLYWTGALQHAEGDGRIERGSEPGRRSTAGGRGEASGLGVADGRGRQARWSAAEGLGQGRAPVPAGSGSQPVVDAAGEQAWLPRRPWECRSTLADSPGGGSQGRTRSSSSSSSGQLPQQSATNGEDGVMGYADSIGAGRDTGGIPGAEAGGGGCWEVAGCEPDGAEHAGNGCGALADDDGERCGWRASLPPAAGSTGRVPAEGDGWWDNPDWVACRDGKRRPVESRTFPLAHGVKSRVGKLRGYGNAIVVPLAATFIAAVMDAV